MRRLATQRREDAYKSNRDYQTVHEAQSLRVNSTDDDNLSLFLLKDISPREDSKNIVGFGGFVKPEIATTMALTLTTDIDKQIKSVPLSSNWNRISIVAKFASNPSVSITLGFDQTPWVDFWGINSDDIGLSFVSDAVPLEMSMIDSIHIAPETLYLDHSSACLLDIDPVESTRFKTGHGDPLSLKKCSYCGRLLPIDLERPGKLSFHKHRAKITNHQNECRSCKKWRINNSFNPMRTIDQLNESALITRERKIFLQEPEILQEIKDRTGAGLKSQVWERFHRKCFNCRKDLKLSEVQLDHTRPLAYLWPIDEHATCLCAQCNNTKKDRFPVDFYSEQQIRELSDICGLPYQDLCARSLNLDQLDRIERNIAEFSKEWDVRTFASTARRISEVYPARDLFETLKKESESAYNKIIEKLKERPDALLDEALPLD
uniref:SapI restriction endonuclease n=1 Tax=Saccharopolyspora sp. TaxID=33915 RepID=O52712_9PSEU|nr:SapI restriction endonuclease [Saccharopolyspora sp.]